MRTFIYLFCLVTLAGCTSVTPPQQIAQPVAHPLPVKSTALTTETTTPKIIHITDTHFGCENEKKEEDKLRCVKKCDLKQLLDKLALEKNPSEYVIVFTGDAVADALKYKTDEDYQKEMAPFEELKAKTKKFTILAVPGNHDYGSGAFYGGKKCADNFKTYFGVEKEPKKLGDAVFIGLDLLEGYFKAHPEKEECIKDKLRPRKPKATLDEDQLRYLKEKLEENQDKKYKVVYLHHDPYKDSELIKVLKGIKTPKDGKVILLFGHTHENKYIPKNVQKDGFEIYNAGNSASYKDN